MANIKPFQGYRPPPDIAGIVSSPPYDVITSDEARIMAQCNPHSFLHIIKPEIDFEIGNEPKGNILHKHGCKNLQKFISEGTLVQDKTPCFYIYQIKMGDHMQTGIMSVVSVEEYNKGVIKKHEFTHPDKEDDRTRHIEITNANTGPVFLTYRNDGQYQNIVSEIISQSPEISFRAEDEVL